MTGKSFKNAIDDRHITLCHQPTDNCQDSGKGTNMFQDSQLISLFDKFVSSGSNNCSFCTQAFFASFMKKVDRLSKPKKQLIEKYCTRYKSVDNLLGCCSQR